MKSRITPIKEPLSPRYEKLRQLLEQEELSIKDLSARLGIGEKAIRSYLSEVAKVVGVERRGAYGSARYRVVREKISP